MRACADGWTAARWGRKLVMFDFAWSEFALIGVVGLLLIGPKDMPVAIRTVTGLIKKARGLATESPVPCG
ncbi:hypothetical protein RAA17_07400 [Komagataeibacter rhaeticus]|nr:hypothetical protein [Komagataeibacter rhaeticus]